MWVVNRLVLDSPRWDHWKMVLLDEWTDINRSSPLAGDPFRDHHKWD